MSRFLLLSLTIFTIACCVLDHSRAVGAEISGAESLAESTQQDQHIYVLFYRSNDRRTRTMQEAIESHVEARGDEAKFLKINAYDRDEREIVEKFDARRLSLPSVVCLAPNGAVSGIYSRGVSREQLNRSWLTPKYADLVQALQKGKIAVVSLMPTADSSPLSVATQFVESDEFADRVEHIEVNADDPAEENFFSRVKVERDFDDSKLVLFAPPGRFIGTFEGGTSFKSLTEKVHSSGSCNCEKCRKSRAQ